MQGIREHGIQYVVVIHTDFNYYLPSETVCFDLLYTAYPEAFRLVEEKGQLRIYEVLLDSAARAR
jgi:hypothetical protein